MKLGLARHFQIPHNRILMVDGSGFDEWAKWYDTTEVDSREVPLAGRAGETWDHCYCSDLPRAIFTANHLFKGPIVPTPLLREVPFSGFLPRKLKLPLLFWQATSRMGWYLNHKTQSENRTQTLGRIAEFVDLIQSRHVGDQRILIVSHGFYMQFLEKALVIAGFRGQVPVRPHGGIIYPFERV
ncbi:MAG: putative phosphoglycerate mutase family protein [Fibrobacteres bacterium]|nr:putative phosphoglycerate mutase family protein [Fibrobacterota bacterium]